MSTPLVLTAQPRPATGSASARRERSAGRVPAILYGHGQDAVPLSVDAHALELAFHTAAQVFMLDIGGRQESCLVKEVQFDTFGVTVVHVDFARIDLSEEVSVEVTLEFRGTAKGVQAGGVQIVHHPALAVRCRADSIPDVIVVDVSGIEMGHGIHAGEIALPPGVSLDEDELDKEEQVVGVVTPRVEAEPTPAEAAEGEAPAEGEAAAAAKEGEGDAKGKGEGDAKGKGEGDAKGKAKG